MGNELTLDRVYKASYVLNDVVRTTDLLPAPKIKPGVELYLKTENLQVTGSFKVRGAYYKMSRLSAEEKARGVVACSAGNNAQGVALAAKKNNIAAPGYLEVDLDNLKATLVRAPQLDEIPANIKIMHVIEYYAR